MPGNLLSRYEKSYNANENNLRTGAHVDLKSSTNGLILLGSIAFFGLVAGIYAAYQCYYNEPKKMEALAELGLGVANTAITTVDGKATITFTTKKGMEVKLTESPDENGDPQVTMQMGDETITFKNTTLANFQKKQREDIENEENLYIKYGDEDLVHIAKINSTLHEMTTITTLTIPKKELEFALNYCLKSIGTPECSGVHLELFKNIYNLQSNKDKDITVDTLRNLQLTDNDKQLLIAMRSDPAHAHEWNPENTNHFLKMFCATFTSGLNQIYKHIFTNKTMQDFARFAREFARDASTTIDSTDRFVQRGSFALSGTNGMVQTTTTVDMIRRAGSKEYPGTYIKVIINGTEEKVDGQHFGTVQDKFSETRLLLDKEYPESYEEAFRALTSLVNADFLKMMAYGDVSHQTHSQQLQADSGSGRSEGVSVNIVMEDGTNMNTFDNPDEAISDTTLTPLLKNALHTQFNQYYRTTFAGPVSTAYTQQRGSANNSEQATAAEINKYTQIRSTVAVNFESTRTMTLQGTQVVGRQLLDWIAELKFSKEFVELLKSDQWKDTTSLGIEEAKYLHVSAFPMPSQ